MRCGENWNEVWGNWNEVWGNSNEVWGNSNDEIRIPESMTKVE